MGNTPSKLKTKKNDNEPIQQMSNLGGFVIDEKTPIWRKSIYIQPLIRKQENGQIVYEFLLFHKSRSDVMTLIHSFGAFHPLKKKCIIEKSKFPIISFQFETDSFESDSNQMIIVSLDFSKSFSDILDIREELQSMPFPVNPKRKMTMLEGPFFFHVVDFCSVVDRCSGYRIYIISSPMNDQTSDSTIREQDCIIGQFFTKSDQFPQLLKQNPDFDDKKWVIHAGDERIEIDLLKLEEESGEGQISITDFLAQQQSESSQPQSATEVSHLENVFVTEWLSGGCAKCVPEEQEDAFCGRAKCVPEEKEVSFAEQEELLFPL